MDSGICVYFVDLQIETALGNNVKIASSPVDLCRGRICYGDGCQRELVTNSSPLKVDGESNSFVGINAYYTASCTCGATMFDSKPEQCEPDTCLNNGTCMEHWSGYE